jgi:hypothetical protein
MLHVMFERFTEQARQVIVLAQEESRTLKHGSIDAEHLLLGLIRVDEGIAARVLKSFDITLERVRPEVVRLVGEGDEVGPGQIPFTPRAKRILELSLREAQSLGDTRIDTEHLLLGLLRENAGVPARIMDDLDANTEKMRNEVLRAKPAAPTIERYQGRTRVLDDVTLAPRARVLVRSAAARALEAGRTTVGPGDLLDAMLADQTLASVLSTLGLDAAALRERLQSMGWAEPDAPEEA